METEEFEAWATHIAEQLRHRRKQRVSHRSWCATVIILTIGTLAGLILMAAQFRVTIAKRVRVRSIKYVTDLSINNTDRGQAEVK